MRSLKPQVTCIFSLNDTNDSVDVSKERFSHPWPIAFVMSCPVK